MTKRDRRLPTLRQALARAQLITTAFAVALTALIVLLAGVTTMGIYSRTNLGLIARTAGYSVAPAIVFNDRQAATSTIQPLVGTPGVARIDVLDSAGRTLISLKNAPSGDEFSMASLAERLFLSAPETAPVEHEGQRIGSVLVHGRGDLLARYFWLGIAGAALCLVPALIASLYVSRRLQSNIVGPLRSIARVAHDVRVERAFDRRADTANIDEIEGLRSDFNALIGELQSWQEHLRRENEALSHRALHDPLTDLPNRAHFETKLAEAIATANRQGQNFVIFYTDGNGFKGINDRYGHAAGDHVLVETGRRLRSALRSSDFVARIGGDEFAMLLGPPFGVEGIAHVQDVVNSAMAAPFIMPNGEITRVSLSMGSAIYPDDGQRPNELVHSADVNMYEAKINSGSARDFASRYDGEA
nr:diguanylate cyclase [uncultured Sphingomonas sp.]